MLFFPCSASENQNSGYFCPTYNHPFLCVGAMHKSSAASSFFSNVLNIFFGFQKNSAFRFVPETHMYSSFTKLKTSWSELIFEVTPFPFSGTLFADDLALINVALSA